MGKVIAVCTSPAKGDVYKRQAGKPLIDGAIDGHYGTVTAVTGRQDPCLACMNPEGKEPVHISSSLGTTTMIVGALEAQLAVAYLAGQKRKGGSVLSYCLLYTSKGDEKCSLSYHRQRK